MIDGCLSVRTWAGREIAENVFATSDCVWRESGDLIDINDQPIATCCKILAVGSVKVKEWRSLFFVCDCENSGAAEVELCASNPTCRCSLSQRLTKFGNDIALPNR